MFTLHGVQEGILQGTTLLITMVVEDVEEEAEGGETTVEITEKGKRTDTTRISAFLTITIVEQVLFLLIMIQK